MSLYSIQIHQIIISNGISGEYLTDFPEKLPEEIKKAVEEDKAVIDKITEIIVYTNTKERKITDTFLESSEVLFSLLEKMKNPLTYSIIQYNKMASETKRNVNESIYFLDFNNFLKDQIIILFYSLLDGLLRQVIDIVAEFHPSVKTVKSKKIKKRLNFLVRNCMIVIDEYNQWSDTLSIIEEIRHILVHNMGIIDKTFLKKTKNTNLKIGDRIKVENKFMSQIVISIPLFIAILHQTINNKYFKEFQIKKVYMNVYPGKTEVTKIE